MRNLREFSTIEEYQEAELVYPAVSLIASGTVIYDKSEPIPPTPVIPLSMDTEDNTPVNTLRIDLNFVIDNPNQVEIEGVFAGAEDIGVYNENGYKVCVNTWEDNRIEFYGEAETEQGTDSVEITALTEVATNVYEFVFPSTAYFKPIDSRDDGGSDMQQVLFIVGGVSYPIVYPEKGEPT